MQQLPITIRRSVLGMLGMVLVWFLINVLVMVGLANWPADPTTREALANLAVIIVTVTGLVLILSIYLYWAASMGCALLGAVTAVRQVLLQNIPPDQMPHCWPSLEYMIENLSLGQALQLAFKGTVDCVEINWTLFDLSIPEWSLLFFVAMLILGATQFSRVLSGQGLRFVKH